jgi:formamidopyrimidine-DNA glycosylase
MIEHPEAVTIAVQMAETLVHKRIRVAMRGNKPHKWAFYSRSAEEYAAILKGRSITAAEPSGSLILIHLGDAYIIVLGGGGERILYHTLEDTVPKEHQLLLHFDDDTFLTVKVQGWGACQLWTPEELAKHKWYAGRSLSPTEDGFTWDYFMGLFNTLKPGEARSVKYFLITEPGVWGIGNGYLQDILFNARIHPRSRAVDLGEAQRRALYEAISETIKRAVCLRGRTDEYDLFGERGGYERILSSSAAGMDCPDCGEDAIVRENFLGGAIYYCPRCQKPPRKPARRSTGGKKRR